MSPSTSLWSRINRFFFAAHLVRTATVWLMTGSFNQHRRQLQTILHSPHEFSWSPVEIYFSRLLTAASWAQSNVEQETFLDLTLLALQCIYAPLFQVPVARPFYIDRIFFVSLPIFGLYCYHTRDPLWVMAYWLLNTVKTFNKGLTNLRIIKE